MAPCSNGNVALWEAAILSIILQSPAALGLVRIAGNSSALSGRSRGGALVAGAIGPKIKVSDRYIEGEDKYGVEGEEQRGFIDDFNPFSKNNAHQDSYECDQTHQATSSSVSIDRCPDQCPFFVQDRWDKYFCSFRCVSQSGCAILNPDAPIGDVELGVCRSCVVDHCAQCDNAVVEDRCLLCHEWYYVGGDGQCYFEYAGTASIVGMALCVVLILVVVWVIDLVIRPCTNPVELRHAEASRFRQKLKMDPDSMGNRKQWPWGTNIHRTQIAGPGMLLHFNFQLCVIIWACCVACLWMAFCHFIDKDLWTLGTRKYGTPRDNCILVAWGHETQHRLMWSTVLFLQIVYVTTFLSCILYGVYQLRRFQELDVDTTTMKDFAAMLVGLQGLDGSRHVEEELKDAVERETGQKVIGVSVAWCFKDDQEMVEKVLAKDLRELLVANEIEETAPASPGEMNFVRRTFYRMEQAIFGLVPEEEEPLTDDQIRTMLLGLKTSPRAVVVFESEDARDAALAKTEGVGMMIEGIGRVDLDEIIAEPDSVQWEHFGHSSAQAKTKRIVMGFGAILVACVFWGVVFYAPYAYYVLTFDYRNGRQTGPIVGFCFTMIVAVGNCIMYEVCARVSDWVGFRFRDNREACYLILYTIACMSNFLLDFVTTYMTQVTVLTWLGFRTYEGKPLGEVTSFTEMFETYGMQRALAENVFTYAFPSTFLVPFLIEWMPSVFLPWYFGKLLVRSHPEVRGVSAEQWLEMIPMDLARYADLLLNTILGILIFYFPGGSTWTLFFGLAGSHAFIYCYDYYKVLRQIPHCDYVAYDIEWWCQAMFAPIVGIIASALVFKMNCHDANFCFKGTNIVLVCCLAWAAHTFVHITVLRKVVPLFGLQQVKKPELEVAFWHCAQHIPSSWFTANPVNCLRSKYILKHSPPCDYYYTGKESLMRENADIGCHFKHRVRQFRMELSARSA